MNRVEHVIDQLKIRPLKRPRLLWVFVLTTVAGCAPAERLTFPRAPLREEGDRIWYDVDGNGKGGFALIKASDGRIESIGYDDDEDGRIDRVYRLADYDVDRVPHLIVLLDSLPFAQVAQRYEAGDFRWFDPPQKVIAPFPSLTEDCYTELMHAPPLRGVIDQYYDRPKGVMHNALWERAAGYEEPWETRLHYHALFWEQAPAYLNPRPWHAGEMARVHRAINQSPDRVTLVYVTSASGMMCKYGRQGCDEILDDVKQLCLQILYERQGAIKISLMADHGHNLMLSKNVHLAEILTQAGFKPCNRIEDDRDVIPEIDGLVTYAGVHTRQPAKVALALLRRDEIELAMYVEADGVVVRSAKGEARVECKDGLLRYRPIDSDVLAYQPVLDMLKANGKSSPDGFAKDRDWLTATTDHEWPDAPRRIWDALHGRAANLPTVMLSIKDGWCVGQPAFEHFITMASTHGGLNQVNSATFVMSMTGRAKGPMRTWDVMGILEPGYTMPAKRTHP